MLHKRAAVVTSITVLVSLLVTIPAGATDAKHKQDQLRRERQAINKQLDLAKASDAKVEAEVGRLDVAVRRQQARLEDAMRGSAAANADVRAAEQRLAAIDAKARAARSQLVKSAVKQYMSGTQEERALVAAVPGESLDDRARREAYVERFHERGQDVLDELRAARQDQEAAKGRLEAARRDAAARAKLESDQAALLRTAKNTQVAAHNALQARIADLQAESRILAAQESQVQALLGRASRSSGPIGPVSNIGLAWPLRGPVTSEFGPRWGGFHSGMDIAPPAGTPIGAAKAGTVVYAGYNGGYGNFVIIDHGGGVATAYAHMATIAVQQGGTIAQGGRVGTVGSTGHSTGPHLHYEVRINGSAQNPRQYHAGSP